MSKWKEALVSLVIGTVLFIILVFILVIAQDMSASGFIYVDF